MRYLNSLALAGFCKTLQRLAVCSALASSNYAYAHGGAAEQSLRGILVPSTPGLLNGAAPIVTDKEAAIQLGKALFWDANVGSDGMACGSCHFHAGADSRTRNQLDSGIMHSGDALGSKSFTPGTGPNHQLKAGDFPLIRFADPSNKNSPLVSVTDDIVGSSGTFMRQFQSPADLASAADNCDRRDDDVFHLGTSNTRRVTKRNAPTVINAALNFRNFWDGRANNIFNGVSPFGDRDLDAGIWLAKDGAAAKKRLHLKNASLASQAVGPPMDATEMSCGGRTFHALGRKLLSRRALESQSVHEQDSVLAGIRDSSGKGLSLSYGDLVKKAFAKRFWSYSGSVDSGVPGAAYTQMEANFALFFGLAIQLYENTLISDQALFDQPLDEEGYPSGFSEQQKRGFTVFADAHCANCHSGPTFSAAVNPQVYRSDAHKTGYDNLVDRTVLTEQADEFGVDRTLVDTGFANTSVTPNDYDIGLGGKDPYGNPLSFTEQYLMSLADPGMPLVDPVSISACMLDDAFIVDFLGNELRSDKKGRRYCASNKSGAKVPSPEIAKAEMDKTDYGRLSVATKGAFKIPTLRNIELTGPYMHNGGMKSLEEVVEFYNRGGNFSNRHHFSTLVFAQGFTEQQKSDLVAFLKTLTDDRVRWEKAPFDHPELYVPHGHGTGGNPLGGQLAEDLYLHVPAVGKNGRSAEQGPLLPFDSYLQP